MIAMVTGHRKLVPQGYSGSPWAENSEIITAHHDKIIDQMKGWCKTIIETYNQYEGPTHFITGMAIGADQLFARAIIELMDEGYYCFLLAAVPFLGQDSKWPISVRNGYNAILSRCNYVGYICDPGYASWKMQKRNEWMVDNSSIVLSVWNGAESGGTYNCIGYARLKNRYIQRLDPETLQITTIS